MKNTRLARYLPITTSQSYTGAVRSSSIVPIFCSSASRRMVSRGGNHHIMKKTTGSSIPLMVASAKGRSMLFTKKKPVRARNIRATM